ncbi:hypothetical protein KKH42_00490, partial [bacterium]|nr:hypothetical protein [bacterium]
QLKGEPEEEECRISFSSGGRSIPENYVSSLSERFRLLMRLSRINSIEQLDIYGEEILDRFGEAPEEVKKLIESVKLKIAATASGISSIDEINGGFNLVKNGRCVFYALTQEDLIKKLLEEKSRIKRA